MMYGPCTVTAKVGDGTTVTLAQSTNYPFEDRIILTLTTARKVAFPLYLRVPAWCDQPALSINGKKTKLAAKGGDLVRIARTWSSGDKIVWDLPMVVKVTTWARNKDSVSLNYGPLTFSVKIGEKYVPQYPDRANDKWPALEILPSTPWNYGLVVDKVKPEPGIRVAKKPFPASNQPFTLETAPIELKVPAKCIPNWTENYFGVVDKLQQSPIKSDEPRETVTMIPMGCGRLRLSALPLIGEGPNAKPWVKCGEPISSFSEDAGILKSLTGPGDPRDSRDGSGMFLMYGGSLFGSKQWIRMPFDQPRKVSKARTYWWTEFYENGGVRPPASWSLFYKDGQQWKPVKNAQGYGVELNKYNEVTFDPVETTELKIEIQFQRDRCCGLIRWQVE